MKKRLVLLFSLATLGLVSCGGGNDVASSGASAVSAAAPVTATVAPEVKINGQVDERTGVAPVVAAMTPWSPYANGGCANSSIFGGIGPVLTNAQFTACGNAIGNATTNTQCSALGGSWWCKYGDLPPHQIFCGCGRF